MISIKDITVTIEGTTIIKNFSLEIRPGEIHAIMGPNGTGKSTLAKVIAGHPDYEVVEGEILIDGKDVLDLEPEERACLGIFLGFQYPVEIPGITNYQFLLAAYKSVQKAQGKGDVKEEDFKKRLFELVDALKIPREMLDRAVNDGFSGGEKKRNEILQMFVLDPTFVILDETDSGLDIDALKVVANGVNRFTGPRKSLLLITHYQRLLDYIEPDFVHVMLDGKIVKTGGASLALELEAHGYDHFAVGAK